MDASGVKLLLPNIIFRNSLTCPSEIRNLNDEELKKPASTADNDEAKGSLKPPTHTASESGDGPGEKNGEKIEMDGCQISCHGRQLSPYPEKFQI
jgi:hypothetical protein